MGQIILRTPLKRFKGLSKTRKALVFLSRGYGGSFYSIPKWSIIRQRKYKKPVNDVAAVDMIEIVFDSKAMESQHPISYGLKLAIEMLENSSETQIIR